MTIFRAAILFAVCTTPAVAQVRPLPAVSSPSVSSAEWSADAVQTTFEQPAQPVSSPIYPIDIFPPPSVEEFQATQAQQLQAPPAHPPVGKDGFLQQLAFQSTYLPQFNQENGFGVTDLELSATGGLPFPTRDSPLLITPYFASHFMNWPGAVTSLDLSPVVPVPGTVDLPATLYDAQVEFRWLRQWNQRWGSDISVTPGLHSDFQTTEDAFRLKVQTIGAYDWSPTTKLVLGVAYLDRNDVNWLPIAGFIWTPNDDIHWELVFPRPKLAQRIRWDGRVEDWWYIAGELGGDQWATESNLHFPAFSVGPFFFPATDTPFHNVITTRDIRVMLGVERKVVGGLTSRFEIGYVFNRKIEFESDPIPLMGGPIALRSVPDFDPDPTLMVRAGVAW